MSENTETKKDDLFFIKSQYAKDLLNQDHYKSYKEILLYGFDCLKKRSFLDIKKIKEEIDRIENLSIDMEDFRGGETDLLTLQRITARADGFKSRLSDILCDSQSDYETINKWYEQLEKIWASKSQAKSQDKRIGEAAEILIFLLPEKIKRKEIYEKVKNKFNLMGSKLEAISREITICLELRKSKFN